MVNILAEIVQNVANNINANDIEEYDKGLYNLIDLPQNPSIVTHAIEIAEKNNLKVVNRSNTQSYVKISADKKTWIRFNLYECDEEYYGNKGDVNSLDMTENIYQTLISNN